MRDVVYDIIVTGDCSDGLAVQLYYGSSRCFLVGCVLSAGGPNSSTVPAHVCASFN